MRSPLPNEFALQIPSVADGTRPNLGRVRSFTDFINHLVCSPANAYSEPGSGVWYDCPP